jgi:hypothetical protein
MSDMGMEMDPYGSIYDWLAMQQYVLPEWVGGASKNAHYAPPDVGSAASQLNYMQDMLHTGMDPFFAMLSPGGMNPANLESTYEEDEITPAVTAGTDKLRKIVETSPMSVEGGIAAAILEGKTPEQALDEAVSSGAISVPMKDVYQNGQKVGQEPDNSVIDRYRGLATDLWSSYLDDTPEMVKTPGKEIKHPFVEAALKAGYTDPRQQYTSEFINPGLETQRMGRDSSNANAMEVARRAISGQKRIDNLPSEADVQGRMDATARGSKALRDGMWPIDLDARESNFSDWNKNLVAPNPDPGSARAASRQIMAARNKGKSQEEQKKKAKNASRSMAKAGNAQGDYNLQKIKTNAAAGALQRAGRSPFMDEVAARMQAIAARGIGA